MVTSFFFFSLSRVCVCVGVCSCMMYCSPVQQLRVWLVVACYELLLLLLLPRGRGRSARKAGRRGGTLMTLALGSDVMTCSDTRRRIRPPSPGTGGALSQSDSVSL